MEIREAQIADAAAIARVHVDTWHTTYRGIVPEDYLADLSYSQREQLWRTWINAEHEKPIIYVAQDERSIVGFASGGPEGSGHLHYDGELYAIYILDAYQCQGIGRELVSRIGERLLEQGMESLVVWVLAVNPSRRFYERLGGKEVAEKTVRIGGVQLDEVAYAWCDIRRLAKRGLDTSSVLF